MANKNRRNLDFEAMIAKGELGGADGFQAHTPNGVSQWKGTGRNKQFDYEFPEVEPGPTRPAGRSNRTGE